MIKKVTIEWSKSDGGYIATIPEYPYLSAFGYTTELALKEAQIAYKGFKEVESEDSNVGMNIKIKI